MAEFSNSLDVANTALQLLGVPRVTSFTQDSKAANAVNFVYDKVRRAELQRNVWRFSTRVVALRAIDSTVMELVPAAWNSTSIYPLGSIVSYQGEIYQSLQPVPANQEPDLTEAYWDIYFGSMNVVSWAATSNTSGPPAWNSASIYNSGNLVTGSDGNIYQALLNGLFGINPVGNGGAQWLNQGQSAVLSQGYFAGELVYVLVDGSPLVYLNLLNGNATNPSVVPAWSASITYNAGDTVDYPQGSSVTYNGAVVTYDGLFVTYNTSGGVFQSTEDLNLGNVPGTGPQWEFVPANEPDVMQGQSWLLLNATVQSMKFVYPTGSGPGPQTTTRNAFQLPNGYLKEAPQDPKAGQFSFLGAPTQTAINDWMFAGNFITSSDAAVILLRFVADTVSVPNMTSMFCNGLACRVATAVCEELTQSTAKLSMVANEYKTFMGDARMSNAIENSVDELPLDDYIACRI